jgi:hypothetical protein
MSWVPPIRVDTSTEALPPLNAGKVTTDVAPWKSVTVPDGVPNDPETSTVNVVLLPLKTVVGAALSVTAGLTGFTVSVFVSELALVAAA